MNLPIFLGGEAVETAQRLAVTCSYDGGNAGSTFLAGPAELERAIEAAQQAAPALKALPAWKRHEILMGSAARLRANRAEMGRLIALEACKPLRYALGEVDRALQVFEVAAEESRRMAGEYLRLDWTPAGTGRDAVVKWFPAGLVAGISPFNFPLNLAVHKVAPAFAAGCPIILKPSRNTPLSMLWMARLMAEAGLPAGALSVLPLDRDSGTQLVTDPRFAVLTFTGSPEVGWWMKSQAGRKRVVLELGGNAGVIIDRTADLAVAVPRIVTGAFAYAGQVCIHTQRIFVHEALFVEFSRRFVAAAAKLRIGPPAEAETDVTALIDEDSAKRVEAWVAEAREAGAQVLLGGRRNAAVYEPTILTATRPEMRVCCDEVFGPVVTLEPFADFGDALQRVNASRFGLQAGVFTDSLAHMQQAFDQLDVGGVIINDTPTFRVDHMPYGGVKDSGLGREGVKYAMADYLEMKVLVK